MGKFCMNCGKELSPNANFCGKCGSKVPKISAEAPSPQGAYRETAAQQTQKYVSAAKEKFAEVTDRENVARYASAVKAGAINTINDTKNFKSMSSKKKRSLIIRLSIIAVVILAIAVFVIPSFFGVSDAVVSEAALSIAEQDYGYALEMSSYEIIDSFTAKADNVMTGKTQKAEMYLVILEATANDSAGNPVEEVTYGVSVVDPGKSDGTATYSPMSTAENLSGMDSEEAAEYLREATARFH